MKIETIFEICINNLERSLTYFKVLKMFHELHFIKHYKTKIAVELISKELKVSKDYIEAVIYPLNNYLIENEKKN